MRLNLRMPATVLAATLAGAVAACAAGEKFAVLKAGSESYTNVVVTEKTATHLLIQHATGTAMVRLKDLEPELQRKFNFVPAKAAEIEQANRAYIPPSETATREYQVPDSGVLHFAFPNAWKDSSLPTFGVPESITVRFEKVGNGDFMALISTLPGGPRTRALDIRQALINNAARYLPNAMDTSTPLMEFHGPEAEGMYFSITNKPAAEGSDSGDDFKYQTQGLAKIGETAFSFTIFSNVPNTSDQKAALEMVRAARYTGMKPGTQPVPATIQK